MKRLALAAAVTGALGATAANAAVVSEFSNGVLVPYVLFDSSVPTSTAVGMTSCANGRVFWTFFDVDSKHLLDGDFPVTANDNPSFIWSDEIRPDLNRIGGSNPPSPIPGAGFDGELGYLVFVLNTTSGDRALDTSDAPCLAGNAFQVYIGDSDVAYIPTLPLQAKNPTGSGFITDGDFGDAVGGVYVPDLLDMDENTIVSLSAGANRYDEVFLQYYVQNGATTDIVIWSAQDVSNSYTVQVFNDRQNRLSGNLVLDNAQLNVVRAQGNRIGSGITLPTTGFDGGFVLWDLGTPRYLDTLVDDQGRFLGDGVVSFSVVDAPAFGARQTIVNPIRQLDSDRDAMHRVTCGVPLVSGCAFFGEE